MLLVEEMPDSSFPYHSRSQLTDRPKEVMDPEWHLFYVLNLPTAKIISERSSIFGEFLALTANISR